MHGRLERNGCLTEMGGRHQLAGFASDCDELEALLLLAKQLIRPAVIHMLNGEVGLVRPIIVTGCRKAFSQGMKARKPMGPLSMTFP
jgi:hypothetical protein